jgi:DNA-binding MarR family transcriptional regulator
MTDGALKLDNQLCFRLYRLSRMFVRLYQPALEYLDLTYPQYLVMLVLWEENSIDYKALGATLELQTGTLTPIIQKLESRELVQRVKSSSDSRKTDIVLTDCGRSLKGRAIDLHDALDESGQFDPEQHARIASVLDELASVLDRAQSRLPDVSNEQGSTR